MPATSQGAPHERAVEPFPFVLPPGFVLPFIFPPVKQGCAFLGISETRFYGVLVPLDPSILIQVGDRSNMDLPRAILLIAAMPRGKRAPLKVGPKKGERKGRHEVAANRGRR
jgi:hypothetical protein